MQKRLLNYFETTLGLPDAAGLLLSAEQGRQALREATFTGLHAGNKKLRPLIEGFTEFELFVLNEIVISPDPDKALAESEAVEIATRKLTKVRGLSLLHICPSGWSYSERNGTPSPSISLMW